MIGRNLGLQCHVEMTIELVRELPEALKPRTIQINAKSAPKQKAKVVDTQAANDETEAA